MLSMIGCPKIDSIRAATTKTTRKRTYIMDRNLRKNQPLVSLTLLITLRPFVRAWKTLEADQMRMMTDSGT